MSVCQGSEICSTGAVIAPKICIVSLATWLIAPVNAPRGEEVVVKFRTKYSVVERFQRMMRLVI
jgi:hypothetical protein